MYTAESSYLGLGRGKMYGIDGFSMGKCMGKAIFSMCSPENS